MSQKWLPCIHQSIISILYCMVYLIRSNRDSSALIFLMGLEKLKAIPIKKTWFAHIEPNLHLLVALWLVQNDNNLPGNSSWSIFQMISDYCWTNTKSISEVKLNYCWLICIFIFKKAVKYKQFCNFVAHFMSGTTSNWSIMEGNEIHCKGIPN